MLFQLWNDLFLIDSISAMGHIQLTEIRWTTLKCMSKIMSTYNCSLMR